MEMSRRKRRRRRILLIALLLVITGLILLTQLHLSPYIRELARNQAVNAASNAITGSVSEMLRTGNTDFSRVIVLEKDVQGNITALRTDMGQVERMKIEVLGALDGLIDQINTQQMGIPLGNLLLPDLLAGTGPVLPVKAVSLTVSNADFFSDFTAAGINQTLQTLKVKFTISLTILTTVGYETVDVDSDVMVAQTVIVGTVPETYVNLGHLFPQQLLRLLRWFPDWAESLPVMRVPPQSLRSYPHHRRTVLLHLQMLPLKPPRFRHQFLTAQTESPSPPQAECFHSECQGAAARWDWVPVPPWLP